MENVGLELSALVNVDGAGEIASIGIDGIRRRRPVSLI